MELSKSFHTHKDELQAALKVILIILVATLAYVVGMYDSDRMLMNCIELTNAGCIIMDGVINCTAHTYPVYEPAINITQGLVH